VEAVRGRILGGDLAPGSRLPPERALAATLGVNRLTLRAALARLSASRLLRVRQGSGYVVRPWRRDGGPDLLAGLVALAKTDDERIAIARDLLAVRRQLAVPVLERLANGVTPEARLTIANAAARFSALAREGAGLDAIVEADLDVMSAIATATGSAVLALCLNPVGDVLRTFPGLREAMFHAPLENVAGYEALLAWLAAPSREGIALVASILERRDEATLARYAAALASAPKRGRRRS
jgi:GntR family transcriptional repressor for pyruvate dehydrogenase complex